MKPRAAARAGCLALALLGVTSAGSGAPAEAWREFQGTWSAAGRRQAVAIEGDAVAAIVELSGAITLTSGEGLSRGFRGEAIGFDDGQGSSVGRCVWTDEKGDRLFSRLKGEPLQTGKQVIGAITGGTGRYAGAEGEYSFLWQYIVAGEDGQIQGRAANLTGRIHPAGEPK